MGNELTKASKGVKEKTLLSVPSPSQWSCLMVRSIKLPHISLVDVSCAQTVSATTGLFPKPLHKDSSRHMWLKLPGRVILNRIGKVAFSLKALPEDASLHPGTPASCLLTDLTEI